MLCGYVAVLFARLIRLMNLNWFNFMEPGLTGICFRGAQSLQHTTSSKNLKVLICLKLHGATLLCCSVFLVLSIFHIVTNIHYSDVLSSLVGAGYLSPKKC